MLVTVHLQYDAFKIGIETATEFNEIATTEEVSTTSQTIELPNQLDDFVENYENASNTTRLVTSVLIDPKSNLNYLIIISIVIVLILLTISNRWHRSMQKHRFYLNK